jgi:hypothetical protein
VNRIDQETEQDVCRAIQEEEEEGDTGISRQIVGYLFGDHLISEPVSVTPSSVIEASMCPVLCFMTSVSQC